MASPKLAVALPATDSQPARETLTSAVIQAAALLKISQAELAAILGMSPASVSRMSNGKYLLERDSKEWQLAALLIRLFRSLDSISGGNDEISRKWLRSANSSLGAIPASLLGEVTGLVQVVQYLDAARAVV